MLEADQVLDRNDHPGICWDSNSVKIMNTHASSACTQFVLHTHTLGLEQEDISWNAILTATTTCEKIETNIKKKKKKGHHKKKSVSKYFPASLSIFHTHTWYLIKTITTWNTTLTVLHVQNQDQCKKRHQMILNLITSLPVQRPRGNFHFVRYSSWPASVPVYCTSMCKLKEKW